MSLEFKRVVVAFLGTECPLAKLYAPRLAELAKELPKDKVAFVAIDANHRRHTCRQMEVGGIVLDCKGQQLGDIDGHGFSRTSEYSIGSRHVPTTGCD